MRGNRVGGHHSSLNLDGCRSQYRGLETVQKRRAFTFIRLLNLCCTWNAMLGRSCGVSGVKDPEIEKGRRKYKETGKENGIYYIIVRVHGVYIGVTVGNTRVQVTP